MFVTKQVRGSVITGYKDWSINLKLMTPLLSWFLKDPSASGSAQSPSML